MGLSYTGRSCFDSTCVTGYRRVPDPPARMSPLRMLTIRCRRHARRQYRSPRQRDAPRDSCSLRRVVERNPFLVFLARDRGKPRLVVEIPAYGARDPRLESLARRPPQFPPNLGRVDRITTIVP